MSLPLSQVSIHAFRGEGDSFYHPVRPQDGSFNPRLPGGRRPYIQTECGDSLRFQSTPSGGKATIADGSSFALSVLFQSTPSGGKATRRIRIRASE